MDFNEASRLLLKGRGRIRCTKWHPAYFIEFDGEFVHEYHNDTDRDCITYTRHTDKHGKAFSMDDVLSEWEIYTEKLSENHEPDNSTAFRPEEPLKWREPNKNKHD